MLFPLFINNAGKSYLISSMIASTIANSNRIDIFVLCLKSRKSRNLYRNPEYYVCVRVCCHYVLNS